MVHFFGIFGPGPLARNSAEEAPAKANFFGGLSGKSEDGGLSRLELEAGYLTGKAPEPVSHDYADAVPSGVDER
jgi:hypothetical protein